MYLIEKMKKTWLLLIIVCCCHISVGDAVLPKTDWSNCRRLYQELGIGQTIGFPAFYKALENYHKYRSKKQNKLVVIDFTKPSTEKRFCVIDMQHPSLTNPVLSKAPWDFSGRVKPITEKTDIL